MVEEETMRTDIAAEEGDEEIIEKKPSAPTASVLMILTAIFLGLAIYLTGDDLSYYFKTKDYENDIRADYYYNQFKRRDARPERAEETEEGSAGAGNQ